MWQTLVHGKQINRDATAANPEIKKKSKLKWRDHKKLN